MSAAPLFSEDSSEAAPVFPPLSIVVESSVEHRLHDAEQLTERNEHRAALDILEQLGPEIRHDPSLLLRHRLAGAWAEMYSGRLDEAAALLEHATTLAAMPQFDDAERAEVLYRCGCVTLKAADVAEAMSLFTRALETNARSRRSSPALAAHVLNWRSRCHQLRRDWDAAARDAESSLGLAVDAGDERAEANALFQVSLVAGRQRQWLLARCHAERALELYRRQDDKLSVARILNNLGGIDFLLGNAGAERTLEEAIDAAAEAGSTADVAQAMSSLAQVLLRTGRLQEARARAHAALDLLAGRVDFLEEIGNTQLVVAQSFAAEHSVALASEWMDRAEHTFRTLPSTSQLAAVTIARGDLRRATGDLGAAAGLYRRAAELLQDFHF
jgi:tetratricopeptide (TPR) repeat protein